MRKFATGLVLGLCLGTAGTAIAAQIVGGNGYLMGWSVLLGGETVCHDPYIWPATNEIECG